MMKRLDFLSMSQERGALRRFRLLLPLFFAIQILISLYLSLPELVVEVDAGDDDLRGVYGRQGRPSGDLLPVDALDEELALLTVNSRDLSLYPLEPTADYLDRVSLPWPQRPLLVFLTQFIRYRRAEFHLISTYTTIDAMLASLGHFSAASLATGPFISVPFISPSGVTRTAALSSKHTRSPLTRRTGYFCLTTTAPNVCFLRSGGPRFTTQMI